MSSNELRIWYLLVDTSGNAFKNATADKVSVPSDADIADFRKAVKAENVNKLAGVAAQLKVFKNKDALSSEPLDEETPVSGIGESEKRKKDALLVLVPESRVLSHSSSDSSSAPDAMDVDLIPEPGRLVYSSSTLVRSTTHISNEGLPNQFLSRRSDTVRQIVSSEENVMFFRAPPCSGKTAMCTLLFEEFLHDESLSVVHLSCLLYNSGSSFADFFKIFVGHSWDDFLKSRRKRVLIVDEVQKPIWTMSFGTGSKRRCK